MKTVIDKLARSTVVALVRKVAKEMGVPANLHIDYVSRACLDNPVLAPNVFRGKKDAKATTKERVERWVGKFLNGYIERISARESNKPGTIPDKAMDTILMAGLRKLTPADVERIKYAHRLAMSAENILGLLLEEYLFEKLSPYGWALCWGETIKSVDFCNKDGKLLQIKNRSNSENSSSSKVREGTDIKKWYRVDASTGRYCWDDLCQKLNLPEGELSEKDFQIFIKRCLTNNPAALAIEQANPWKKFRS